MAEHNSYPIHIRFNDIDAYGHVNNAIYLTYFEEGRSQYFRDKVGEHWDWQNEGILLARNEIDYKLPILLSDEARIEIWISAFGNKSADIAYRIIKKAKDEWVTCTTGKSVIVCFNYSKQQTIAVPETWREIFKVGE